jgi:hypothetical protein
LKSWFMSTPSPWSENIETNGLNFASFDAPKPEAFAARMSTGRFVALPLVG